MNIKSKTISSVKVRTVALIYVRKYSSVNNGWSVKGDDGSILVSSYLHCLPNVSVTLLHKIHGYLSRTKLSASFLLSTIMHLGESMCEDTCTRTYSHTHIQAHIQRERETLLFYIHQEAKYCNQWRFEIRIITINTRGLKEKKKCYFLCLLYKKI